ncbi:MAG: sulfatase [Myxococcales bacterium]|nr:sulfatase [Myxococcales bacterium]
MPVRSHLSLIALLGLVACSKDKPPPPAATTQPSGVASAPVEPSASAVTSGEPAAPPRPLNVLFITVDSLRADMPWTGYERKIAPNLTQLASQSVVYNEAYSTSSYTAQSVASYLSGRYAASLYRAGWFFASYAKSNTLFPEVLQESGVRTLAWHAHMYFGRGKGIDQGFDVWELVPGITFNPNTDEHITSDKMTKLAQEILSKPENTGKPFFAWAHYMDPHDEYKKHPESPDFGNKNRDRYDSEVFFTDLWLGKLLSWCEEQPWWKNTALIVSADHGEAFGEHDAWKHAFDVWQVLVRIPLIIKLPGGKPRRIDARRSMIDIAPTITDLLGQKPLEQFQGQSLVPELRGGEPNNREPIAVELAEDSHNPPRRAVISGDYKLTVWGRGAKYLLFNLKNDPGELKELSKTEPEKLAEMKKMFTDKFDKIGFIEPYGGMKQKEGGSANGPMGPPGKKP